MLAKLKATVESFCVTELSEKLYMQITCFYSIDFTIGS